MRILVIGDCIEDNYIFGEASRICPEAPVPVILPEHTEGRPGGAALVAAQIVELGGSVMSIFGSLSLKERIYAGNHMVCRLDRDTLNKRTDFADEVMAAAPDADLIVVSDYGKGAMTPELAAALSLHHGKKLFVDSKHSWAMYRGLAAFPNNTEFYSPGFPSDQYQHVIHKMGDLGCQVDRKHVAAGIPNERPAVDVCGAGDVFLAAFVAKFANAYEMADMSPYISTFADTDMLIACALYANRVAGISVRHVGTHVVTTAEIEREELRLKTLNYAGQSHQGTQSAIA